MRLPYHPPQLAGLAAAPLGQAAPVPQAQVEGKEEVLYLDSLGSPDRWDPRELEVSASSELLAAGRPTVQIRIDVDHKGPPEYPLGWPRMYCGIDRTMRARWQEFDRFELLLLARMSRPQALKERQSRGSHAALTFRCPDKKNSTGLAINLSALDTWTRVSVPIASISRLSRMGTIGFYVADKRYAHGDRIEFFLGAFRLTRPKAGEPVGIALATPRASGIRPRVRLRVELDGPLREPLAVPLALAFRGRLLRSETLPVLPSGEVHVDLADLNLDPGTYELTAFPRSSKLRKSMSFQLTGRSAKRTPATGLKAPATDESVEVGTYEIARFGEPPRIDAALDDACWRTALHIDGFRPISGKIDPRRVAATDAFLGYDEDALYVAYRCAEPMMDQLAVNYTRHDGPVWKDDCVEVFLNPSGDRVHYAHIVANAAGVVRDAFHEGSTRQSLTWESGAEVKTRRAAAEWTIEMRIPLDSLPLLGPTTAWTFQLVRTRCPVAQHLTMLREGLAGFHETQHFARLVGFRFRERVVGFVGGTLGELYQGINVARVTLRNYSDRPRSVRGVVGLETSEDKTVREAVVPADGTVTLDVPWTLGQVKAQRACLAVFCGQRRIGGLMQTIERTPDLLGRLRRNAFVMTPYQPLRVEVPIALAEGSRSNAQLRWRVADQSGDTKVEGQSAVTGDVVTARLFWPKWEPGHYTLELALKAGGREETSAREALVLVQSPFPEDIDVSQYSK